jgi:nitroimidazol reductase NimA-like FMN-containing flavoprotein (pyridoxamine 5'-phosphate oxidase superfamily)
MTTDEKKQHVVRHSDREEYSREEMYSWLDSTPLAHVGFIDPDTNTPFVIPMGFVRDGDRILLHGSTGSRVFMTLIKGVEICLTVTHLDGLVVARSAFNCSMNYRSVMIFGKALLLEDGAKLQALEKITNGLIPGHWDNARPMLKKESVATIIVEVPLTNISGKSRAAGVNDEPEDIELPIWAGVIPMSVKYGSPEVEANAAHLDFPANLLELVAPR